MNGIHDMGGMHGLGPVDPTDPGHAAWELRMRALSDATDALEQWTLDRFRYFRECLPAVDYLTRSYYEQWLMTYAALLVDSGLVTEAEWQSGRSAGPAPSNIQAFAADRIDAALADGGWGRRTNGAAARFRPGDRVTVVNRHPDGHTRAPRYVRGRTGIVERDHGVFVLPDTNAHGLGESSQHVYGVRFAARELWGDAASPRDSVSLDLWDDYLRLA